MLCTDQLKKKNCKGYVLIHHNPKNGGCIANESCDKVNTILNLNPFVKIKNHIKQIKFDKRDMLAGHLKSRILFLVNRFILCAFEAIQL